MFLDKLKSKLNLDAIKEGSIIISETFGDLQKIAAIYCFLIQKKDTIIICKTIDEAKNLFNLSLNFFKIENVIYFPDFNIEPYTQSSASKIISKARIDALYSLISNRSPKLLITTLLGCIFKTVNKEYLKSNQLVLTVSNKLEFNNIINYLTTIGYLKKDKVFYQGEYAVRGDIIDVFPANSLPIRISFFDNIIESIKTFDIFSQRTINNVNTATINVPLEIILNHDTINNFKINYKNTFLNNLSNEELDNIDCWSGNDELPLGAEHYLPLFFHKTHSVFNYLDNPITVFNNTSVLDIEDILQTYNNSYLARIDKEYFYNKFKLLSPDNLLLSKIELQGLMKNNLDITINSSKYPHDISNCNLFSLESKDIQYYFSKNSDVKFTGKSLTKLILDNKHSVFFINLINQNSVKYITNLLTENNIKYCNLENIFNFSNQNNFVPKVYLIKEENLNNGFIFKNIFFICENNLFPNHAIRIKSDKVKIKNKLGNLKKLTSGELLVHEKHGVGKYIGLTTLNNQGIEHDFLELEYSGGDKLYLPVENIDLVNKYGGVNSEAILDKLGNNTWQKRKASVKEKLQEIAYDLIKLAAVRNLKNGPEIHPNPEGFLEFVNAFPYIETDDQLSAIEDIKNDFASNKVADRLICGDVGFGKTEVAMRAAFLAVASGYQVAIIAPTTLLVRQHYYNFVNRFKSFSIAIKQISRFISKKDKNTIKKDLKEGKVDIIIATHALLSRNIEFNKLGLLIIDEEQNFGVVHKEKIKTLKENIHTLNLTATPIPRTLQMALTGVKSLSIIATPPIDKLPIKTYVMPFDEVIVKEALFREIKRNGQIYIVAPYIKELYEIEKLLNNLDVSLKILVLHGKMNSELIENHMKDFQDNKFNVLLSTNIIESGIDLDNVNTIIIINADKFGLSQLYQLRGRVGRGNIQSYAYITYSNKHNLTINAKKRLEAIQNLDYLGAGFTLAEQDLDIRGAGNILGKEQSGHIKGIGIELYNKFLTEEINKLKLNNNTTTVDYTTLSPNIILPVVSLIPGKYINSISTRMEFYQQLANTTSFAELELIINELIDRFGKIPDETSNLVNLIKIKIMCKNLGIEKLIAGTKAFTIYFYNNKPLKIDELLKYIQQNAGLIKLQKDHSIVVFFNNCDKDEIIKKILALLFIFKNLFGLSE